MIFAFSLNWVVGSKPEVVLESTGKTSAGPPSRLCKQALSIRFSKISSLPAALSLAKPSLSRIQPASLNSIRFSDVKKLASGYMEAKAKLVEKLVDLGAGRWVEKPVEQDQFYLEL